MAKLFSKTNTFSANITLGHSIAPFLSNALKYCTKIGSKGQEDGIKLLIIDRLEDIFMYRIKSTDLGTIDVSEEVVETIAGMAAIDCYGLVGMAPQNIQSGITSILGMESIRKGVTVELSENGLVIDVNVIVGYGIKINEVAHNVMQKVAYVVNKYVGLPVAGVNVNIRGVKVIREK
jgi:uncharacterized alkaline shock family protein YloU